MKVQGLIALMLLCLLLASTFACGEDDGSVVAPTPTPKPEPAEMIQMPTESSDIVMWQYHWRYAKTDRTWTLHIPRALYDYYKERPRAPTEDYSVYVTHPADDSYVAMLVEEIEEAAIREGFDEPETVNFAVSFVQSLQYTSDSVTISYDEYPRYPVETLVDYGGDCEDTSILMAAILREMGYGVVLLSLPDHMAVGVLGDAGFYGAYYEHDGSRYFYLETTGEGWEIGEIPSSYRGQSAHIYDIIPVPILTHLWDAVVQGSQARLTVTVENWGTATARDVHVLAGFDAGDNMLWNTQASEHFDLEPDYSITVTVNLALPRGEHTRLVVQIVDDGYAVDQSYSEWFDI